MRNKIFGKQLSRNRKSREALFVSLVKNVIEHGSIITTHTKAQAVQGELDRLMKLVSSEEIAAKRNAASYLRNDRDSVEKLFSYKALAASRGSGFTTITKLPPRRGDNASVSRLSWVTVIEKDEKKEKKSEKSSKQQVTSA